MKEPLSLRISDDSNPERASQLQEVLKKRKANPSAVIRGLLDAYIRSEGKIDFPVRLLEYEGPENAVDRIAQDLGISATALIHQLCKAIEDSEKEFGGVVIPFTLMPRGAPTPAGRKRAKAIVKKARK